MQVQFCEGLWDYWGRQADLGSAIPGCFEVGRMGCTKGWSSNPALLPLHSSSGTVPGFDPYSPSLVDLVQLRVTTHRFIQVGKDL